jgi:hypothetical protein
MKTVTAPPARTVAFAYLLGRPVQPKAPAKKPVTGNKASASERHSSRSVAKSPTSRSASIPFAHLNGSKAAIYEPEIEPRAITPAVHVSEPYDPRPPPGSLAAQILAATAKRDTPTGTFDPPPTGLAKQIINAGRRRDGLKEIP